MAKDEEMAERLIIGLGSGRCGTLSLKHLLNMQQDTHATHETMLLPYPFSDPKYRRYMNKLWGRDMEISADVALWTLSYVTAIVAEYPTTKFICLQRDREETIQSFIRKTKDGRNHWTSFHSSHWDDRKWPREKRCPYRNCYPRFDADKETALGYYWDWYYTLAKTYQGAFPDNFWVFPIEALNSRDGCESILDFAGYDEMKIKVRLHKNKTRK